MEDKLVEEIQKLKKDQEQQVEALRWEADRLNKKLDALLAGVELLTRRIG